MLPKEKPAKSVIKQVKKSKYKPVRSLAEGGFSKVILAKKKNTVYSLLKESPLYAVKICQVDEVNPHHNGRNHPISKTSNRKSKIGRLEREIRILLEFRHCNYIVHTYEAIHVFNEKTSEVWIVMEYLPVDLFDLTGNIKLTMSEIQVLTCGMLHALDFIHSKGYVHKDVKLENILVSRTGYVKLCDFGLTQKITDPSGYSTVDAIRGTRYTMAPELFIKGCQYDSSIDIWSIGVLVSLMLDKENQSIVFDDEKLVDAFWKYYKISNEVYFKKILGFSALDYINNPQFIKQHLPKEYFSPLNRSKLANTLRRSRDYRQIYNFLMRCLVPYPKTGRENDITRRDTLERATILELFQMPFIASIKDKDLFKRQTIVNMIHRYEAVLAANAEF